MLTTFITTITDLIQRYPWVLIALIMHGAVLGTVAYLILLERKVASWVQDRLGPNRVGFDFGLPFLGFLKNKLGGFGQPLADGIKFIVKEDYRPRHVDKILFTLAPGVMILVIIISIAVLPWGGRQRVTRTLPVPAGQSADAVAADAIPSTGNLVGQPVDAGNSVTFTYEYPFQIARLNIGVLFILGVLSLAVYGVVVGGWASNNKYSFLGALRATAQMVSYEIPLGLCVLCIVMMFGTLDLGDIVEKQAGYWGGFIPAWNVFCQPLTFIFFLICIHAEANRAPFDLAEAEQELVGGYHTEYSAMRFALFFLAEYAGMITTSAVCVALFFGGWSFPGVDRLAVWVVNHVSHGAYVDPYQPAVTNSLFVCIVRFIVFFTKTLVIIFVFMWTRWSLPRFRFDQLMMLAWRAMIPISLALMVVTALCMYFFGGEVQQSGLHVHGKLALALLAANIALLVAAMALSNVIPAAPRTNRRLKIIGSRFNRPALPATGA